MDLVNHPPHYKSHPSGVECIEITRHMNFCLGNAIKYIWRAGLKSDDTVTDLEKAIFYLREEIKRIKEQDIKKEDQKVIEEKEPPRLGYFSWQQWNQTKECFLWKTADGREVVCTMACIGNHGSHYPDIACHGEVTEWIRSYKINT